MVKHIILWTLRETLSQEERTQVKANIKAALEGLQGVVPNLLEIHVYTDGLATSNADVMLDSSFTDMAALQAYAIHPAHVHAADTAVRPYTATRTCFDFAM